MTMKTCPECGKRNITKGEGCKYCGASLDEIRKINSASENFRNRIHGWFLGSYIFLLCLTPLLTIVFDISYAIMLPSVFLFAVIILFGSLGSLYWSFHNHKLKRTYENIPTSRIATGAVGSHVEIKGRIIMDPVYSIQGQSGISNSFFLAMIFSKYGYDQPLLGMMDSGGGLFLDDGGDGLAKIHLQGAKIFLKNCAKDTDYCTGRELRKKYPEIYSNFIKQGLRLESKRSYWLEFIFLNPDDLFYVFGFAESPAHQASKRKTSFKEFLLAQKSIEKDPELQKSLDTNQDGILDPNELEAGARKLAEETQKYQMKNIPLKAPVKMVFRHSWDWPLFLGNLKESEIKKELFVKSGDLMWDAVISFGLAFFMFCGLYYVNL